jgi:hypothetical protein
LAGCASRKKTFTVSNQPLIETILSGHPEMFDSLLKKNSTWRIQIIYTQIDRKKNNKPVFTSYYYNVNPSAYFYPASTVKMPTAFLALQKLNEMKLPGMDKNTTMITDSAYSGQSAVFNDPDSYDGRPTVANYVKKIFLVSDNNAFNRLYEFLGQEYINSNLHRMGYDSVQILHRLNISRTEDQNRHTNPVYFYDTSGKMIYLKPLVSSKMVYLPRNSRLGIGYYSGNTLVNEPFDFTKKNRISLIDLHNILISVLFPSSVEKQKRFNLSADDYRLIYRYMSMKPHESDFPQYDSTFNDAYSKLLLYGGKGNLDEGIRIYNKEGDAYGFLNDIAYVVDFKNNIEFILAATILCNSDGIFNDDKYDYETVGYPFLRNLGKTIYQYELNRPRKHAPDLSSFKFNYSK